MSVAEQIQRVAHKHGVVVDPNDRATTLARNFSKIEGIERDETLDLIAQLTLKGFLSKEEAYRLSLMHGDEIDSADAGALGSRERKCCALAIR